MYKYNIGDKLSSKNLGKDVTVDYVYSAGDYYNVFTADGKLAKMPESDLSPLVLPNVTTGNTISATPSGAEVTVTIAASNEAFFRSCAKALAKVSKTRKYFTADDLWKLIDPASFGSAQAMGSFMNEAAKAGRVKPTKRYKRSKRTAGPLKVWQSTSYARA